MIKYLAVMLLISIGQIFAHPVDSCCTPIREFAGEEILAITVEHFTGDADGVTSFTGPASEDFQLTGSLSVDSNPGDGTTGDDQWAGTPTGTDLSNAIGTITLCETTQAFQITGMDCWTSENGGSNFAVGDVQFIGYLHNGGTVSYTTTVTPTNDMTGFDPVSFAGTALDGVDLMSLQFVILGNINYLAIDSVAYSVSTGLSAYNSVPTVSSVLVSGSMSKGSMITGSHAYYDCDNAESGTTRQWYRSDDASGTNKAAIFGATATTYTMTASDTDKYISYEVTPSDGTGTGLASSSSYYGPVTCGHTDYAEDFEDNSGTSFTNNGQGFTITGSNAGVVTFTNYGWNGISNDNRYIDNDADPDANDGGQITVTTTDGTDVLVKSFYVYSAEDNYNRSATANLTITGRKDNVTQFTFTKNSGFNVSGVSNGYTFIDLTVEGGSNNSNTLIDELILSNTGIYEYIAIDAFNWATQTLGTATLSTAAVSTFDATTATMGGEVTDDGCATVTERGVVYNTSGTPTTSDSKVVIGTGVGVFSQPITGLTPSTQYYMRTYGINSEGTTYGSQQTFTTTAPFPIELNSFTGIYADHAIRLNWETASEFQNKGFHVMRLEDSKWQEIGFVAGNGTHQGILSYQFIDPNPLHAQGDKRYYRLAQEDMNGSLNHSNIVEISLEGLQGKIQLFPSPVKDILTIRSFKEELLLFRLFDMQGKLILEQKMSGAEQKIDLSAIAPGFYTAMVSSQNQQKTAKKIFIE